MKIMIVFMKIIYFFICCFLFCNLICCKKTSNENSNNSASCSCSTFVLYQEASDSSNYQWFPKGWMGSINSITCNDKCTETPHDGSTCIKITYTYSPSDTAYWAGIYWINNSFSGPGINLYNKYYECNTCKFKVTFWSKGKIGGEQVQFKVGGVKDGGDSMDQPVATAWLTLTNIWTKYEIDITGKNLSNLVGGFCWVTDHDHNITNNSITIYIDDILYEATN